MLEPILRPGKDKFADIDIRIKSKEIEDVLVQFDRSLVGDRDSIERLQKITPLLDPT